MSDIIKRNWLVIVITFATLAVNGGLVAVTFVTNGKVDKARQEMEDKRKDIAAIKKYQYGMTKENEGLAKKNADTAWKNYDKAFEEILAKHQVATHDPKLARTPAQVVRFVRDRCRSMQRDLEVNKGIKLSSGVENFTFGDIRSSTSLPPLENVPSIVKNVIIVDAIASVLSNSGITHLEAFSRLELKMKESGDVYKYLTFSLTVKGNYEAVRRCVNELHDANFLFILRKVNLKADDIVKTIGEIAADEAGTRTGRRVPGMEDGGGRASGAVKAASVASSGKTKESRIAFKKMASVQAVIEFDYIEITRKSGT